MKTYAGFLNMDQRPDRLAHMEQQFKRIGLTAVRHRGRLPHEYNLDDPKVQVMRNRTPGAIPCHYGQVDIMATALANKSDALVMEDDIVFCEDFNERLMYINEWKSEHEWDVIWLGATFHSPAFWHRVGKSGMPPDCSAQLGKDCEVTDDPRMMRTYGAFSTHCYLVNYFSIEKILTLLDKYLHESIGIDWLFIKLQPQLKCFSFVPGCAKQIDNQSNIGNGITKWSGFLQLNGTKENSAYVYQELAADFNPETFLWK